MQLSVYQAVYLRAVVKPLLELWTLLYHTPERDSSLSSAAFWCTTPTTAASFIACKKHACVRGVSIFASRSIICYDTSVQDINPRAGFLCPKKQLLYTHTDRQWWWNSSAMGLRVLSSVFWSCLLFLRLFFVGFCGVISVLSYSLFTVVQSGIRAQSALNFVSSQRDETRHLVDY